MSEAQKDAAVLRFLPAGRLDFPGRSGGWRAQSRSGQGRRKVMPADGRQLIANEPGYRALLMTLDQFVAKIPTR